LAISAPRRLSSERTRSPAKFFLSPLSMGMIMPQAAAWVQILSHSLAAHRKKL
jgi:hypothetical protein